MLFCLKCIEAKLVNLVKIELKYKMIKLKVCFEIIYLKRKYMNKMPEVKLQIAILFITKHFYSK